MPLAYDGGAAEGRRSDVCVWSAYSVSRLGYIFVYHGRVSLYHCRVPGRPSCISRICLLVTASMTSSSDPSAASSTSKRTSALGRSAGSVAVRGLFRATPNDATRGSPRPPRTEATMSGAPLTRHEVPTRTASTASGGTTTEMREKSSSFTRSTIFVTHDIGGRPEANRFDWDVE